MTTQNVYNALSEELEAIGVAHGIVLTDEIVDHENTYEAFSRDEEGYWGQMIRAMKMQAGQCAENEGLNINKLLGRVIY